MVVKIDLLIRQSDDLNPSIFYSSPTFKYGSIEFSRQFSTFFQSFLTCEYSIKARDKVPKSGISGLFFSAFLIIDSKLYKLNRSLGG